MNPCLTILLRLAQLVFSAIVLAVSVLLFVGQRAGNVPDITKFSIFVGGFGIFMAIFGVVSQIFSALRGSKIVGSLDFITALVGFAGGVAMAANLGPGVNSCDNTAWREKNLVINGGYVNVGGFNYVYRDTPFHSRCQMAFAITAFEFLVGMVFVLSGVGLILANHQRKNLTPAKW
ncbi:hypothetical protein AA313_de0201207 [Arthrobotrys entomopaga]|nr:hypothetical protein AA313_de0201207 [Arthrobotrys entomopaga]